MSGRIANNGIITMHAGDYFEAPLFLNVGYGCCPVRYQLKPGDRVYFGIMEPNQPFTHAIVRKMLTVDDLNRYGDPVIKLRTEDTERLMPGVYYYEVKLARIHHDDSDDSSDSDDEIILDERIDTIISKTKLFILE